MIDHNKYAISAGLFLIDWIKDGNKTIFYKDLANSIDYPSKGKDFAKDISETLELLGTIIQMNRIKEKRIPFLQSLVISKSHFVPGRGYHKFVHEVASKNPRQIVYSILKEQEEVLAFDYWDDFKTILKNYD